jgi:hypothetical protein
MNLKIINPFTIKQLEEIINNGLYENIFYVDTDALAARFQGRIYNGVTIDFKRTISSTNQSDILGEKQQKISRN